jgi:DNA mismatch repair protein MutL
MDAGATTITVEIKDGGISYIRITDNGCGIPQTEVPMAFLRHATSKISSVEDLSSIASLGFRGEALSSIGAVSQVEMLTKPQGELTGLRYVFEGGTEVSKTAVGIPSGTTILIRNLFYNTPARLKFLKSKQTEGSYVAALMEHLALSHPKVSFTFLSNGQTKLQTSGNGSRRDVIYQIYGKDVSKELLPVDFFYASYHIYGYAARPVVSRGNRNFEHYFVNGRYIKDNIIARALEEAYRPYMMQHKFPFAVLYIDMDCSAVDVNVHPAKREVRFMNGADIYEAVYQAVTDALKEKEFIPDVTLEEPKKETAKDLAKDPVKDSAKDLTKEETKKAEIPAAPQPFETKRFKQYKEQIKKDSPYEEKYPKQENARFLSAKNTIVTKQPQQVYEQTTFITEEEKRHGEIRIIGQLFDTYWLFEFENSLYFLDQHAAHEKIIYEQTKKALSQKEFTSQMILPAKIVTLSVTEEQVLQKHKSVFEGYGFEVDSYGGSEYAIRAVPANLYEIDPAALFVELLDSLSEEKASVTPEIIIHRIATASCKAAVKGNMRLHASEAKALYEQLLSLDEPYHCPHGRPTMIVMSKQEVEKKFKRIV